MAELNIPEKSYPPKMKASPWISTMEKADSAFGNGGPNASKKKCKRNFLYVN